MYTYAKKEDTKNNFETNKRTTRKRNQTGIPDTLKSSLELFSGFSLDDVRVHYHSDRPDKLQAFAYTQGNQVYLGPGHENSLPHELGHVIQQKQGRVRVTPNPAGLPINLERELEEEADWIGSLVARGWNCPQSSGLQPESSSMPAIPIVQMDYGKKFENIKAEILANLRARGIIGLSNWGADKFTWHHIYPKTYLEGDLKSLAEHSNFISLGPAPQFRMDDPSSDDLDYDYLPYKEESTPKMMPVSEKLRQKKNEVGDLQTMRTSLLRIERGSDDKEQHFRDIDFRWAQWFIPSNSLGAVFGNDLVPELMKYQRNYKIFPTKIDVDSRGKRETGVKDIKGLPLMSLNKDLLGERLYVEIQRRYQRNGENIFRGSIRRGSQGPIINEKEIEIEHKKHLLTSEFMLSIIGKMETAQKIYLRQISYAVPRKLQNIEYYLSQYGIDISSKTAELTLETIETLDISDQYETFRNRVIKLQKSEKTSDQIQVRKWLLEDSIEETVQIGEDSEKDSFAENFRKFLELLKENQWDSIVVYPQMEESAQPEPNPKKHKRKEKSQKEQPKGKKKITPERVDIEGKSLEELLSLCERANLEDSRINLKKLKELFLPEEELGSRNRQMYQEIFQKVRKPIYQLPEEMLEEQGEEEEELSVAAQQLLDSCSDIHSDQEYGYQEMEQTEVIFKELQELMASDLASAEIRNILLYRAGIMDYYEKFYHTSIKEDHIRACFEKMKSVVEGKIHEVTQAKKPEPKNKELTTAAWNIANQVEIIIGELDEKYLARVEAAILQIMPPIVEEAASAQAEENLV